MESGASYPYSVTWALCLWNGSSFWKVFQLSAKKKLLVYGDHDNFSSKAQVPPPFLLRPSCLIRMLPRVSAKPFMKYRRKVSPATLTFASRAAARQSSTAAGAACRERVL
eukprot:3909577-Rhodomonas_salina.2